MQIIEKDQTNSRLKITISAMNSLRISTSDLSSQSWKSQNLKTSHLKLSSLRNVKTREWTKMKRAYEICETLSIIEHQRIEVS